MHTIQPQFILILIAVGIVLFGCGLLYGTKFFHRHDLRVFNFLHRRLAGKIPFFRLLWPMGKTPFMMTMLGILYFTGYSSGFRAMIIFGIIACLERSIKLMVKRQRPFFILPDIQMSQPKQPNDPSYPSGDAMRIWYLALVIPTAFGLPVLTLVLFCCIAVLVCLGRISFGVHFPLDVLGGMGLGFIGAGLYHLYL